MPIKRRNLAPTPSSLSSRTWRERAWQALRELAQDPREPFTSDDLIERVGVPDSTHGANSRNSAIGPLFRKAAQRGLIVSYGPPVKSTQKHRKGGMVRLWCGTGKNDNW